MRGRCWSILSSKKVSDETDDGKYRRDNATTSEVDFRQGKRSLNEKDLFAASDIKRRSCMRTPHVHQGRIIKADGNERVAFDIQATSSGSYTAQPQPPEDITKETMMQGAIEEVNRSKENAPEEKDARTTLSFFMRFLPRPLKAPTNNNSHLYQFWNLDETGRHYKSHCGSSRCGWCWGNN